MVAAVLRKERKATAEFVDRYADPLGAYLHQRLIPRTDLVDDLLQEVFLAAWENLAQFRGQSSLKAWLVGIARHKIEGHYRARLREAQPLDDDPESDSPPAVEPLLDELVDRKKLQARISEVLASLPEAYSAALQWRYFERRSTREMAERTGKTLKAVERLLARARTQFRRRWRGE